VVPPLGMPRPDLIGRNAGRRCGWLSLASVSLCVTAASVILAGCSGQSGMTAESTTSRPNASSASVPPTRSTTTVTAAPELAAPGDIPDSIAYVPYRNDTGRYSFVHPEGWAQSGRGTHVDFTDKYNGVSADSTLTPSPPSLTTARANNIPKLGTTETAFQLRTVAVAVLPAGPGVVIVYRRNSPADPVTGKSVRQEVQRYEIFANGRVVTLELFGAVGADNVDPYARISRSLRLS
jgi:hypothetical protein